ncbi:MAG: hypothetical protein IT462_13900 [Planctomycetes bacterium]|nr:hypothetical protein [Planctomycetota bacterium]
MKTILAAVAAGIIGGGAAAVGAVSMGLVQPPSNRARAEVAREDAPAGDDKGLKKEIDALRKQLSEESGKRAKLENELVTLGRDKADKSSLDLKADKSDLVAIKATGPAVLPDGKPVPEELNASIRAVMASMEAEKTEKDRVAKQDARVKSLEERKTRIRENVPKFMSKIAEENKLNEQQKSDIANILINHLVARSDIASEQESLRIDGKPVDKEGFKMRTDGQDSLTQTAISTLLSNEEVAKKILMAANRMSYGMGADGRPDRPDRPEGPFGPRERPERGERGTRPGRNPGGTQPGTQPETPPNGG